MRWWPGSRRRSGLWAASLLAWLRCHGAAGQGQIPKGDGPTAPGSTRWRVVNLKPVSFGWAIGEIVLYSDPFCIAGNELTAATASRGNLVAEVEASGSQPGTPPARALDGQTWTEWRAPCFLCDVKEAWLSIRFTKAVSVKCVRLWQVGRLQYSSSEVSLERWEESTSSWQQLLIGTGLTGDQWDRFRFVQCEPIQAPTDGVVQLSNGGFYPCEATVTCTGARLYSGYKVTSCRPDGTWDKLGPLGDSARRCWTVLEILVLVSLGVGVEVVAVVGYYLCIIVPRDKVAPPLPPQMQVPEEYMRRWNNDLLLDVRSRAHRQLWFCLACPFCRLADTWRSFELLPYPAGVLLSQTCCPFLLCIGAHIRGKIRARFMIYSSKVRDWGAWICCSICAAAQEARHMDGLCDTVWREHREAMAFTEKPPDPKESKDAKEQKKDGTQGQKNASAAAASKYGKPQPEAKAPQPKKMPMPAGPRRFERGSVLDGYAPSRRTLA